MERLISADSHVAVNHDQVKNRLASKFHKDYDAAVGRFSRHMADVMGAGQANAESMRRNPHAAFSRPGYHDGPERLKDMDTDGVDVEVVYSEVSGFRYLYMLEHGSSQATRAFNGVLEDFASADPQRLVVSYQIPIHDVASAVQEVQRVASVGGRSLQLPVFPAELGVPDYYDRCYDPLWSAISETGLPICCHIGLNTALDDLTRRDPTAQKAVMVPMAALSAAEAMGMWIMGGVLERFPELQLVFVEPGLGWVAWYVYIIDDMVRRQGYKVEQISELPSHYFHHNIHLTFIEEPDALGLLRDRLGVQNLLWSTDYPHPVTSWPDSRRLVQEQFRSVPPDERHLILSGNAARLWSIL